MKKTVFFVCLSLFLALLPPAAPAEEGSPLLSVDDLIVLEDSYEAFLKELGDLAVERGLLSEEDRAAWSSVPACRRQTRRKDSSAYLLPACSPVRRACS